MTDDIEISAYTHWSGQPVDDKHSLLLVPQSVCDGWGGYCSCGVFRTFKTFYEFTEKESLIEALRLEHSKHLAEVLSNDH